MNKEFNLEEDIKEFVMKKIKDVKTVDDIISNYKFKISKPQDTDYGHLYKQLWKFKKTLQLTLNVYNHYAVYSECRVKFGPEDISLHFYNGVTDDMPKVCVNRPKDREVVEALYNYIHCFLSIQCKDSNPGPTKEGYVPVTKCSFCDQDLVEGEQMCPTCRADIQDMRKIRVSRPGTTKVANEEIGRNIIAGIERKNVMREKDEAHIRQRAVSKETETDTAPKWTCGKCEMKNGYDCLSCGVCYANYVEGRWMCTDCKHENGCERKICKLCGKENIHAVKQNGFGFQNIGEDRPAVDNERRPATDNPRRPLMSEIEMESQIRKIDDDLKNLEFEEAKWHNSQRGTSKETVIDTGPKWTCGKCEMRNGYDCLFCGACYAKYEEGRWMCAGCNKENDCDRNICRYCHKENVYVVKEIGVTVTQAWGERPGGDNPHNTIGASDDQDWGDRWRCDRCRLLQAFEVDKCSVCYYSRYLFGSWKCRDCTTINKCDRWECGSCNKVNERLVDLCEECKEKQVGYGSSKCYDCQWKGTYKSKDYNERKAGADLYDKRLPPGLGVSDGQDWGDRWRCDRCSLLQAFEIDRCSVCDFRRSLFGSWKCRDCTTINKCNNWKCDKCKKVNGRRVDLCEECREKEVGHGSNKCYDCQGKWICNFKDCNESNVRNDNYCNKCRFCRYGSDLNSFRQQKLNGSRRFG